MHKFNDSYFQALKTFSQNAQETNYKYWGLFF